MTHLSVKLDTRQSEKLTPRLQYAVRLLQLSSLDYEQELHDIAIKNPFLEVEESEPLAAALPQAPDETMEDEMQWAPQEPPAPSGRTTQDESHGAQTSALDVMAADIDLRQHLRSQANLLSLSERDRVLVWAVIESLDDDAYLRVDLAEIADMANLDPPADACEMSTALKLVQSLEPAGVGARDVAECLLLQIQNGESLQRELIRRIVTDHLDRLAQGDIAGLARRLECPTAEVEAACDAVRRLDPRPGWRFGKSDVLFIKPDVVARKVRGSWTVQLNPATVPSLTLNRAYAETFLQHRKAQHAELATCLQEARWALRNAEQRFLTILAVAQAIGRRQHGFFEHGPLAMKPLALREVADEVGVHESTVCRVTHNKYMATPAGLIELKRFFSRPMAMADGGACSPMAVRGLVQEIIGAESPMHPLSDVEVARRLARQGLKVARRTVTKYRQMLNIPAVEQRRPAALSAPAGASAAL